MSHPVDIDQVELGEDSDLRSSQAPEAACDFANSEHYQKTSQALKTKLLQDSFSY